LYYEEKVINRCLYYRYTPDGDWKKFNEVELTMMIMALQAENLTETSYEQDRAKAIQNAINILQGVI